MKKIMTGRDAKSRPYVVCHMLTSLDGKIDGAYMNAPECSSALKEYGNIRSNFQCQAVLYGTTTMLGSYSDGYAGELPVSRTEYAADDFTAVSNVGNYIVSLDPKGVLGWDSNFIEKKNRPKAHVIEVLSESVSNDYLAYLREKQISYIFAGREQLDLRLLLEKLNQTFAIERLMVAGGGLTNWSFAQAGLIDELSIVIAPVADGNTTAYSIFEKSPLLPEREPVSFQLEQMKELEGGSLWLRYLLE